MAALSTVNGNHTKDGEDNAVDMSISIDPADVALVQEEMDVTKDDAEKALRRNAGDPVMALRSLIAA